MQAPLFENDPRFDRANFDPALDRDRLARQITRIWSAMQDGEWHTLPELQAMTHVGQASIGAQLRNLRKPRFGGYAIEKRRRGAKAHGLWEYRLLKS